MDQLRQSAVRNYLNLTPTHLEKLMIPLLLNTNVPNVDRIDEIHHPISVIDSVPQDQLEQLAQRIKTVQQLKEEVHNENWWYWCYIYTQLRASTVHPTHSQEKIGKRDNKMVEIVKQDIEDFIDHATYDELESWAREIAKMTPSNEAYWNHVLYLIQNRAAFIKLSEIFNRLKANLRAGASDQSPQPQTLVEQVKARLPENELLFDSGRADPQYAARAVIGEAPNYIDKSAVVHEESWLNTSVKGYKFTIFYRDIASGERPKYKIEKKNDGTANIVFSANNYPSLTFNILDKKWDRAKWARVKCTETFNKGTLHLQFGFKD